MRSCKKGENYGSVFNHGGPRALFQGRTTIWLYKEEEEKRSACASWPGSAAELRTAVDAGLMTFALTAEARLAAFLGEGFYTIGPEGCASFRPREGDLRPAGTM